MNSWSGISESKFDMRTKIWCGILEKNVLKTRDRTLLRTLFIGLKENFALLFAHVYVHLHVFFFLFFISSSTSC